MSAPKLTVHSDAITAPADQVTGADFLRSLTGDPNDISNLPQASGFYLRGGEWLKIKPEHVGVKDGEQLTECRGDPMLAMPPARAVALRVEPSSTVSTASPLPSLSQGERK